MQTYTLYVGSVPVGTQMSARPAIDACGAQPPQFSTGMPCRERKPPSTGPGGTQGQNTDITREGCESWALLIGMVCTGKRWQRHTYAHIALICLQHRVRSADIKRYLRYQTLECCGPVWRCCFLHFIYASFSMFFYTSITTFSSLISLNDAICRFEISSLRMIWSRIMVLFVV